MDLLEWMFCISVTWIVYVYAGYPLALAFIAMLHRRRLQRSPITPSVTIVIAAYNEHAHIADAIRNKLELEYPQDQLELIVVSDGSTDGTDEIVEQFAQRRVRLLRQESRQGKTAALNRAVALAKGELIMFSDANSMYARDALRHIVENFADPEVGYVTGKMVYVNADGSLIGDGCSTYMKYENVLRSLETHVGSVVGVDGGIDVVRRALFQPMRADQLPDFVLPLRVVAAGYRVIYEPSALLKEQTLSRPADEFRMRVRVSLRSFWALLDSRSLLQPFGHALFSFQLWSHKVLRYLVFVPMLAIAISSIVLWNTGPVYRIAVIAQLVGYGLVLLGTLAPGSRMLQRVAALPSYFVLVNVASGVAFWRFLKGEKQVLWKPRTG